MGRRGDKVCDGTVWHVAGNWINVDGAGVLDMQS